MHRIIRLSSERIAPVDFRKLDGVALPTVEYLRCHVDETMQIGDRSDSVGTANRVCMVVTTLPLPLLVWSTGGYNGVGERFTKNGCSHGTRYAEVHKLQATCAVVGGTIRRSRNNGWDDDWSKQIIVFYTTRTTNTYQKWQ